MNKLAKILVPCLLLVGLSACNFSVTVQNCTTVNVNVSGNTVSGTPAEITTQLNAGTLGGRSVSPEEAAKIKEKMDEALSKQKCEHP